MANWLQMVASITQGGTPHQWYGSPPDSGYSSKGQREDAHEILDIALSGSETMDHDFEISYAIELFNKTGSDDLY